MGVVCSTCGGEEGCIQGLVGKTEGKRSHGNPRLRWEDKIDFRTWDGEHGLV